jgi:hypothetical protein|tara:strand:+ start:57 stop:278 length:222 start_codon:yes stop_codon:yes gene_type:complete
MLEALYIEFIGDTLYWACVHIIQVVGDKTGMGYQLANLVIFIFLQPGLILLFFILWRREKRKSIASVINQKDN